MSLFEVKKYQEAEEPVNPSGAQPIAGESSHSALLRKKMFAETFGPIKPFHTYHYFTQGAWSMDELLEFLLSQIGPANVWLSTWAITEGPLRSLTRLIEQGQILSLTALFDHKIDQRKPESLQLAMGIASRIKLVKCHAKVLVLQNDNWGVSVVSSANFTKNPRLEAGVVDTHPGNANFHRNWIEAQFTN